MSRRATTTLFLSGALLLVLSGCGTFSSALRTESALTAGQPIASAPSQTSPPSQPAPTVQAPPPAAEPAAASVVAPVPSDRAVVPPPAPLPEVATDPKDDDDVMAQARGADAVEEEYDPWERFNEPMFSFNRNLDRYVLKPVAKVYNKIMPEPFQIMIANGFDNIAFVPRFVNNLLQAKWGGAGRELGRFLLNSTIGVGGLFDVAKDHWGIQKSREDFGQTLGVWGSGPGPYLILPFLEPLTVRDGIGKAVDGLMDPLSWLLPFIWDRFGMKAGEVLNDRSLNLDLFQGFEESVIDMYSAVRHAYLQRRQRLIKE
jgi:phospholipid-binding lipoprotein MlaA